MAKQAGILKFIGTIDELTFYRTEHGDLVRRRGTLTAKRIRTDPSFRRTRENNQEFTTVTKASKLLRLALRSLTQNVTRGYAHSRLVKQLYPILAFDTVHARGQRTIAQGLLYAPGRQPLNGFEFNPNCAFSSVFMEHYDLDPVSGVFSFPSLVVANTIVFPPGATHAALTGAWLGIDFTTESYDLALTVPTVFTPDATLTAFTLTPSHVPVPAAFNLYLLKVSFYQEVNGVRYVFADGRFNAMIGKV